MRGDAFSGASRADCEASGKEFVRRRPWARFCSATCRRLAHDRRRRLEAWREGQAEILDIMSEVVQRMKEFTHASDAERVRGATGVGAGAPAHAGEGGGK